jgi:aspartyl-tRNA synthetase
MGMLLLGEDSIRQVMAFPKNQNAACIMSDAPTVVDRQQLDELAIDIVKEER